MLQSTTANLCSLPKCWPEGQANSTQLGKAFDGMGKGPVQRQHVLFDAIAKVTQAVAVAESCGSVDLGKVAAIQIRQLQGLGMELYLV